MAGMPKMQAQFSAIAMDGGLSRPSMAFEALGLLPVVYAENAGAIFGGSDGAALTERTSASPPCMALPPYSA
jgi:hypothetical protein